jgi:hypothetical protein
VGGEQIELTARQRRKQLVVQGTTQNFKVHCEIPPGRTGPFLAGWWKAGPIMRPEREALYIGVMQPACRYGTVQSPCRRWAPQRVSSISQQGYGVSSTIIASTLFVGDRTQGRACPPKCPVSDIYSFWRGTLAPPHPLSRRAKDGSKCAMPAQSGLSCWSLKTIT